MLNISRASDQLGDYTRIPAKQPEDVSPNSKKNTSSSSRGTKMENMDFFTDSSRISPSSETKMKNKNLLWIWNWNRAIYETQQKKKKKDSGKLRTIWKCLHYLDKKEAAYLIVAILASIGNGFVAPFNIVFLLTPLMTIFVDIETPGHLQNINSTEVVSTLRNCGYNYYILGVMNFVLGILQIVASEIVSRNIMTKIKASYLSKMLSIEIGRYDHLQGQFVSSVSQAWRQLLPADSLGFNSSFILLSYVMTVFSDLQNMKVLFDSRMTSLIEVISFFFFGCLAGFIVSWKVTFVTIALTAFSMTTMYFIIQTSKKVGVLRQQYNEKCTKVVSEILGNLRTVTAYGSEFKEIERYNDVFKMSNKHGLKQATLLSLGKGFNFLLLCICYMVSYYYSVRLYLGDDFDPAFIVIVLSGTNDALYHCVYLLSTVSDFFMATDSAQRVLQFLDTDTSYSESIDKGIIPNQFEANISFRNVQFSYPSNLQTKVLQDLTLNIEPGKVTAVVGTSGAGKSTIVGLISRLYDVTSGQILIGGVDVRKFNISWLRNQISVVGQEPKLFDTSVEENIRYGKTDATLDEIIVAAKISYIHGFIDKLPSRYDTIVGESGMKLSGGQKQRIAIARAMVRKPKLLILDEATSALDLNSEGIVQEALDNAMSGRTALIIAHRMSTVRKADVIYAIREGCVVEKGSHSELMELKGYYYSLAKAQEVEEKDKAISLNHRSITKEEQMDGDIGDDIVEANILEAPEITKELRLNKENLKKMSVWFLAIFFTAIISAFLPTLFYVHTLLYQSYTHTKDELSRIALVNVGILFGLGAVSFVSVILSGTMSTVATQQWLKKIQQKSFSKIVSMDISWYDWSGNSPNECLEVMTNSPPLIESVTGDKGAQVAVFILSLVFSLGYAFYVSTKIALANLPIVLIVIITNCLRMRTRDADSRSASIMTRSTKIAIEYVQNIDTIQTLNCQMYVLNQYRDMLVLSKKEAFAGIVWNGIVYGLAKTVIRLSMGTTFIFGAKDIASGYFRGTSLVGINISLCFTSMLAGPALILMSQYPAARQAISRLCRIAFSKSTLSISSDKKSTPEIFGNIVFQDITFSYPTRDKLEVLKKLNLKIEAGKTVALVGDSGCGKSTIISLLERFYIPNEGKILIDGNDINDINVRYLRSQMGLVLQEPVLFNMTIKENILYGYEGEVMMDKIIEAAKIANIHNFIMKLPQAYDTSIGERGSKLSMGQKQRIAIARAVLRNPKILLLDEPTSALDTESENAVQEALENASIGKTTIVIAHRLSTIRKADKIVVLQSGQVIEEGDHEQLMEKRGHYFNLLNR